MARRLQLPPPVNALVKLGGVSVGLVVIAATAALWTLPPSTFEVQDRRQREAEQLIDGLIGEIWSYYHDHGCFPPGDGGGSRGLVQALRSPGRRGRPYRLFAKKDLTPLGDLRNPVSPETSILQYRNNQTAGAGVVHNRTTFDLWGRDKNRRADGLNNWE